MGNYLCMIIPAQALHEIITYMFIFYIFIAMACAQSALKKRSSKSVCKIPPH